MCTISALYKIILLNVNTQQLKTRKVGLIFLLLIFTIGGFMLKLALCCILMNMVWMFLHCSIQF